MKKLSKTEAELEKVLFIKKRVIFDSQICFSSTVAA